MPLYSWESKALKNYAPGEIIVSADSTEEAREAVRGHVEEHLREERFWMFDSNDELDEECREEVSAFKALIEKDIAPAPLVILQPYFISGSE